MHVHVSALDALITFGYIILFGFFWRLLSARLSDHPIGKAMATLY